MENFRRCEKLKKKKDFDSIFQSKFSLFRRTSSYNFVFKQNSEFFRKLKDKESLSYDFVCIIKKSSSPNDKKALDFEDFIKSLQRGI